MSNRRRFDNAHSINAALDIHFDKETSEQTPQGLVRAVRESLSPRTEAAVAVAVIKAIQSKRIRTAERRDALLVAFKECQPARNGSFDSMLSKVSLDPNKYLPEQE